MFQEPGFKMGLMPAEMRVSAFFCFWTLGVYPLKPQFLLFFCRERKEVKENTTLQTSLSRRLNLLRPEAGLRKNSSMALKLSSLRDSPWRV